MNITRRNFLLSNLIIMAIPGGIYANIIKKDNILKTNFQKIIINPDPIYIYSLKKTYNKLDNIKAILTDNIYEEYILSYDIQVFNTYKNFNKLMEALPNIIPFNIDYIKDSYNYNKFTALKDYYHKYLNGYIFHHKDKLNIVYTIKSIGEYNYNLLKKSHKNIPKGSIIYSNDEPYSTYQSFYSFI